MFAFVFAFGCQVAGPEGAADLLAEDAALLATGLEADEEGAAGWEEDADADDVVVLEAVEE